MNYDINVKIMDMDVMIPEQIVKNADDSYTIFINARHSYEKQLESYKHAIHHIESEDFNKEDVQVIESVAHGLPEVKKEEYIPSIDFEKRLKALRKERASIQRKMRAYEEKMEFLRMYYKQEHFFDKLEEQYLYGDDL